MINDFGSEFINLLEDAGSWRYPVVDSTYVGREGFDISDYFDSHLRHRFGPSGGFIVYFPPGRYFLPRRSSSSEYVFPENVQLYFCPGALLRPASNVDLVIRGSIRAGKHQIFGYDRSEPYPDGVVGINSAPMGRVILASLRIREVYPEWWGAYQPPNFNSVSTSRRGLDSSDALQAAINAACVLRDDPRGGERRPAIPIILGAAYQCNETLVVECPPGVPDLNLILRGGVGLSTINIGHASIVRMRQSDDQRVEQSVLRLGPRVDFDLQDLGLRITAGEAKVNGCLDIVCDDTEVRPRRGLLRRCTLTGGTHSALRIRGAGSTTLRHIVVDSCTVTPGNNGYLSRRGIEVDGDPTLMLHVDGGLLGLGVMALPDLASLPPNATMHLRGWCLEG